MAHHLSTKTLFVQILDVLIQTLGGKTDRSQHGVFSLRSRAGSSSTLSSATGGRWKVAAPRFTRVVRLQVEASSHSGSVTDS